MFLYFGCSLELSVKLKKTQHLSHSVIPFSKGVVAKSWREGEWSDCWWVGVSFWAEENVLELVMLMVQPVNMAKSH